MAAPRPAAKAVEIFRLACWFGLALAVVEIVARWVLSHFEDEYLLGLMHPHAAWMTVASACLLFASVGGVLALLSLWALDFPVWLATAAYAALFFYGLGDVLAAKQWYASAVLALGLACASARSTIRLQALARRTLWPLAGAACLLAAGTYAWSVVSETRATASLPPAPAASPNLLFITLDTVRADRLSLYGYHRPTSPHLEEFGKRGVVFDQAISTVSWTLPSHASMFTGYFPPTIYHDRAGQITGDWKVRLDKQLPTLAEYLDQHGYRSAGFVANWDYCDRAYGLGRGYARYVDYNVGVQQMFKSSYLTRTLATWLGEFQDSRFILARKNGQTVNREFLGWLDGAAGKPFCAFLNYMDSHDPYNPPPEFVGRFSSGGHVTVRSRQPSRATWFDPDNYDCGLAALDSYVGELLDELDQRGVLKSTLVVLVGDHGEEFGEHSYYTHGHSLYRPVVHVPLIVVFPGRVPAKVRVHGPTSLRDLAATVVDLLGLTDGSPFPGTSLRGRWDERHMPAPPAFSYLDLWYTTVTNQAAQTIPARLCSVVDDRYHYIEGIGFDFSALYDWQRDPEEKNNLAQDPAQEALVKRYHVLAHSDQGDSVFQAGP